MPWFILRAVLGKEEARSHSPHPARGGSSPARRSYAAAFPSVLPSQLDHKLERPGFKLVFQKGIPALHAAA